LYQALVLLLFNQHQDLSYKDIQDQTKIRSFNTYHEYSSIELDLLVFVEDAELQRTLQSLACGKIRLLTKKPMVKQSIDSINNR
jgi:cullin 4